jgi:RimJ/RimL family protein N-acetyltransferase
MSSFYDYDDYHDIIVIGYTFIARAYWGLGINGRVKTMMMEYAFDKLGVKHVLFHVDENNIRSQKALEKIGIKKSNHDLWVKDHENDRHNLVFVKSTVAK